MRETSGILHAVENEIVGLRSVTRVSLNRDKPTFQTVAASSTSVEADRSRRCLTLEYCFGVCMYMGKQIIIPDSAKSSLSHGSCFVEIGRVLES